MNLSKKGYDLNVTYTSEHNIDSISSRKSYKGYWRRALNKIRINRILQKLSAHSGDIDLLNYLSELDAPIKKKEISYTIVPYSKFYLMWILFLTLSMLYLCSYGIFYYSFYPYNNSSRETIMELAVDLIFILDICISLNLSYFDEFNNLIKSRKMILVNYIKNFLLLDFISAFPLGIILRLIPEKEFSAVFMFRHLPKILKLFKIRYAFRNFSFIKAVDSIHTLYKFEIFIAKLSLVVLFFIHIAACIFYLVARAEDEAEYSWVAMSGLRDSSIDVKYLTSLYWALVTLVGLGYGDIRPYTSTEYLVSLSWQCLSVFLISYSLSSFNLIYSSSNKFNLLLELSLQSSESFASQSKLPKSLSTRLKLFIKQKKLIKLKPDLSKLFQSVPQSIKLEVALNMYQKALTKIPFFTSKAPIFISTVAFWLEFMLFNPNDFIFHRFSYSDSLYFLITGRVKILYEKILFYVFKEGEIFGDLEVFTQVQRRFDVISCEFSKVFKLKDEYLENFRNEFPDEFNDLKERRRLKKMELVEFLAEMICFRKFAEESWNGISKEMIRDEMRRTREVFRFQEDKLDERIRVALENICMTGDCIEHCHRMVDGVLFVEDLV